MGTIGTAMGSWSGPRTPGRTTNSARAGDAEQAGEPRAPGRADNDIRGDGGRGVKRARRSSKRPIKRGANLPKAGLRNERTAPPPALLRAPARPAARAVRRTSHVLALAAGHDLGVVEGRDQRDAADDVAQQRRRDEAAEHLPPTGSPR